MIHAMKKNILALPLAAAFLFLCASCGDESSTQGDAQEDGRTDTEPEPPAEVPDAPADPAGDIPADPAGEEAPPAQGPITFIVRSVAAQDVYLDWQTMGSGTVEGGRTTGAAIMPISYWPPFCMEDCASSDPGGNCCIACMPAPSVRVLGPGEELTFEWDGRSVYEAEAGYCLCSCYRAAEVTPMAYIARACVYHSYTCWGTDPCEPNPEGVIAYANVEGDPACAETLYDIPYAATEVFIDVQ